MGYVRQHLTLSLAPSSLCCVLKLCFNNNLLISCIATGYGLDGPGIESRWGARFSASVQTGPGTHPASCTMGTGSFPGGRERPGRDADPSLLSIAVVKKE
jgi:hypothetical protein